MNTDRVVRATARNGRVRIFSCLTTELVAEMQRRHHTWPIATAALGRVSSVAAMMGMMLKNNERITLKIDGDGPIGQVWAEASPDGHIRGYVDNPFVDLPHNVQGKLNVGGAVGRGSLYVIRDTGLKDFYTSSSELQTGEIADDFTYYFVHSEQTPSAVGVGVLVGTDNQPICAGGFLVQMMPGYEEADIAYVEERLANIPSVTDFLLKQPSAEALLHEVLPDAAVSEMHDLQFACRCSYDRLGRVLLSLGADELTSLRDDIGQAELTCHFCGNVYTFSADNLTEMIRQIEEPEASE